MSSTGRRAAAQAAVVRMGQLGLTQAQLAARSGVDVTTISTFFNGHHWPQARNRAKLEAGLDWPAGRLGEIAAGDEVPVAPATPESDPVEAQIAAMPHLLDEDREMFLKVYRVRRDEQTARRMTELEHLLAASLKTLDPGEVRDTIASQFRLQIEQLRSAGYAKLGNVTET